jgi:DNA-binding IscR family transcriptional regulator
VVEIMIGEISLNDCIARPAGCKVSYHCAAHRVWLDARDQLRNTLRQVNFEQLITDVSCFLPFQNVPLHPETLETTTASRTDPP